MKIDPEKMKNLVARELPRLSPDELRREGDVFFIGGNMPERETLETLFDSHCRAPVELFHLTFGAVNSFHRAESLAKVIKKNFNAYLVGRVDYPASSYAIERAYAAGVDILDIPLTVFDRTISRERGLGGDERLRAIDYARSVFPRWSVVSTLIAGEEPVSATVAGIDALLALEVIPLVTLSRGEGLSGDDAAAIYNHLDSGWRRTKALVKPLLPLIHLATPLVPCSPRGAVGNFLDRVHARRLLAASDLRRSLRVKQVEESFGSSGL